MLIVDGHVVDPATGLHEIADVLIEQDCIKKIYVRSRGDRQITTKPRKMDIL